MARIEGGCLCRKVCHSADASRSSSACATAPTASASPAPRSRRWSPVPAPALKVTGTLKTFTNPGDTGRPMPRRFCPECDSGVVDEADVLPGVAMLNASMLDDRSWVRP
jgi:hypothetical protein